MTQRARIKDPRGVYAARLVVCAYTLRPCIPLRLPPMESRKRKKDRAACCRTGLVREPADRSLARARKRRISAVISRRRDQRSKNRGERRSEENFPPLESRSTRPAVPLDFHPGGRRSVHGLDCAARQGSNKRSLPRSSRSESRRGRFSSVCTCAGSLN